MKKHERREPCGNCPFRVSAPLAYWHPKEYLKLLRMQHCEHILGMSCAFDCHKDHSRPIVDREPCIGWLINQRSRGVPSIALRVALRDSAAFLQFNEAQIPEGDHLYDTVSDLVSENIAQDQILHPERYE